ncbi:hypothetical protein VTL71DRAFT_14967 [Oculimacula yallundae]|uniref:Pre-mRNA-splicing factor n=1 Tax=Oculimacula yallundae TaxID=86028 RepID=A0ABR4CFA4_9HELO
MSPSKETPPAPPPKLGIKGFSLSAKPSASKPGLSKSKTGPPSSNLGKRPRATFQHDSESEDERGNGKPLRHEAVSGFGDEGAERVRDSRSGGDGSAGKGELVIKSLKNRDWRGEMARKSGGEGRAGRRDLLPAEERARRDAGESGGKGDARGGGGANGEGSEAKKEGVDVVNGDDGAITWGLTVRKRAKTEDDGEPANEIEAQNADQTSSSNPPTGNIEEQPSKPQTADEEALASLLGAQTSASKPILTIPAAATAPPLSEQETYRLAVLSAPDPSSLEDYERIPVEEFGAALLRGMGWKGEKNANPNGKGKEGVKRRQNLLGLGAKELDGAEELGAWVQKSDVKRLNPGGGGKGGFGGGGGERRPKAGEYKREKERERERREERGGGSYRREKERERERERDGGRDRRGEYRR